MGQLPVLDEEREAAQVVGLRDDDAFDAALRDDEVGADRVRVVVDARDHAREHVLDVSAELEGGDLGQWRQLAEEGRERGQQRQDLVTLGLLPEERLELCDLVRTVRSEVVRLAEVVGQVVELGRILVGVPDARGVGHDRLRRQHPRDARGPHGQPPAVLVHGPVADRLEILLRVPFRCVGRRQGVREGHPVEGLLGDAIDRGRCGDAGDVEDGRRDVDDMRELGPERAAGRDACPANARPSDCGCRRDASRPACPIGTGCCPPRPRPRRNAAP